jgi:2-dehydropantoate 2-reductase
MRICVFGAGATGGHMAVRLAAAGHEVSVVARGAHLAAIQAQGLTLIAGEERLTQRVAAAADPAALGVQELVIVALKATGLAALAEGLPPLVGPGTRVVFPQNGIPWWYPLGLPPGLPDLPVFRLGAAILRAVPAERVLGGTIYSGNALAAPGVVENTSPRNNRLEIAEVAGGAGVAEPIRAVLRDAGLGAPDGIDPRRAVWRKLMNNMPGSSIAVLTGARSADTRTDPALREVFARIVQEGLAIAAAQGHDLREEVTVEKLQSGLSLHKASLLQDYELGRPMEVGEILLSPVALARAAGLATPVLDTAAALTLRLAGERRLFDRASFDGIRLW